MNKKITKTAEEIVKMMEELIGDIDNRVKEKIANNDPENLEFLCGRKAALEHILDNCTEKEPEDDDGYLDFGWYLE